MKKDKIFRGFALASLTMGIIAASGQLYRLKTLGIPSGDTLLIELWSPLASWLFSYPILIGILALGSSSPLVRVNRGTRVIQGIIWLFTSYVTFYMFDSGWNAVSAILFYTLAVTLFVLNGWLATHGKIKTITMTTGFVFTGWISPHQKDPILLIIAISIYLIAAILVIKIVMPFFISLATRKHAESAEEALKHNKKIEKMLRQLEELKK